MRQILETIPGDLYRRGKHDCPCRPRNYYFKHSEKSRDGQLFCDRYKHTTVIQDGVLSAWRVYKHKEEVSEQFVKEFNKKFAAKPKVRNYLEGKT